MQALPDGAPPFSTARIDSGALALVAASCSGDPGGETTLTDSRQAAAETPPIQVDGAAPPTIAVGDTEPDSADQPGTATPLLLPDPRRWVIVEDWERHALR